MVEAQGVAYLMREHADQIEVEACRMKNRLAEFVDKEIVVAINSDAGAADRSRGVRVICPIVRLSSPLSCPSRTNRMFSRASSPGRAGSKFTGATVPPRDKA